MALRKKGTDFQPVVVRAALFLVECLALLLLLSPAHHSCKSPNAIMRARSVEERLEMLDVLKHSAAVSCRLGKINSVFVQDSHRFNMATVAQLVQPSISSAQCTTGPPSVIPSSSLHCQINILFTSFEAYHSELRKMQRR